MTSGAPVIGWRSPTAPWMLVAALLVAVVVRFVAGVHVVDDAFITLRYSQHIAAGLGFTYNPPEHVLGTSTPLFALLMAVPARFGLDLPLSAFVVSVVADVVMMAMVASMLRQLGYSLAALLSVLAIAMAPSVVTYSVSGMETSLYVALAVAVFWALQRDRWTTAAVLAGAAWFCRPDGALVVGAVCALALRSLPLRGAVRVGVVAVAVMAPWLAFATWYFGSPIPSSVLAKADLAGTSVAGFRVLKGFFLNGRDVLLTALAVGGVIGLWQRRVWAVRAWILWGATYALAFAATGAFDNYLWYFTPLMPLYFAAVAVAVELGLRGLHARSSAPHQRRLRVAGPSAAVVACVAIGLVAAKGSLADMDHLRLVREDLYRQIGETLAASGDRCPVAALEIGTLGYYYPGPIVDLVGLVTPEAIDRPRGEVLRASEACWLVSYDNNLFLLDQELFSADWFRRDFVLVDRTVVSPMRSMLVYQRRSGSVSERR